MKINAHEILKITENGSYNYYGLRVDDFKYNVGDTAHNSHQLFQDPEFNEEGELIYEKGVDIYSDFYDAGELDGTCTVGFAPDDIESIQKTLTAIQNYYGNTVHILAGNSAEYGIDEDELIIQDACVLGVFEKK